MLTHEDVMAWLTSDEARAIRDRDGAADLTALAQAAEDRR